MWRAPLDSVRRILCLGAHSDDIEIGVGGTLLKLSDLAWNTFRNHLILEYEILKYDGDLGQPNVFIPLSQEIASRKVDLLLKHFQTQSTKHWFTRDTFQAMHRIRGIECATTTGRAEAFYSRKLVLDRL